MDNPYAPPTVLELEPEAAGSLEPVGFRRRAGARILDLGFHFVLGNVAGSITILTTAAVARARGGLFLPLWREIQPEGWTVWLAGIFGSMLYQVILTGWHGSSLGKRVFGIVAVQENGEPCSPLQAWKRELAFWIDVLVFGLIAAWQMSKSPLHQRLGDKWADTVVVRRRSVPRRSLRSGLRFAGVALLAAAADFAILALPRLVRLLAL